MLMLSGLQPFGCCMSLRMEVQAIGGGLVVEASKITLPICESAAFMRWIHYGTGCMA